ncbi:MAG: ParB N-terminal domain-containing protein [Pseudomonadota bacterium]
MAKRKRLVAPDPASVAAPEVKTMLSDAPIGHVPTERRMRAPIADQTGEAAAQAALTRVAGELATAKAEGRMVVSLPLSAIEARHLVRDRVALDASEMDVLKASLAARGQQTPIEVVELGAGRYGLLSGWRRLSALRELGVDRVDALIRQPAGAAEAYTAMVEENEVRASLSYFERANIVARAVEEGVFPDESSALSTLFASASRAKRSKIKSFVPLVENLGRHLSHPTHLSERLGLSLAARLASDADWARRLKDRLRNGKTETAEDEIALLTRALSEKEGAPKTPKAKVPAARSEGAAPTLSVTRGAGKVTISGLSEAQADEIEALVRAWQA